MGFFEPADGPYHRAHVSDGLDQPGLSFEENARRLASVPLLAEPGTAWIYSLSDDVLGGVLARASGSTLPEVVRRTVTGPLGLVDTGFAVTDESRLAVPYVDGTPAPVRMGETQAVPFGPTAALFAPGRALDKASYPSGGAGMVGTAGEFLRFLEALRTGGQPVLRHESVTTLTSDQLGALAGPRDGVGFGFGLSVIRDPARAGSPLSKGSWQWGGAYGHSWFVDPTARLSVVALTNTAFEGMSGRFPDEVQRAVYAR